MTNKIIILNCDYDQSSLTNGGEIVKSICERAGYCVSMFRVHANEFPSRKELESSTEIIITGSRASVYDAQPWILRLLDLIHEIDILNIPTLGICFGFQAIAKALGGTVVSSGKFESGFCMVEREASQHYDWLFSSLGKNVFVYQSHGDVVTKLPPEATCIARNEFCIQAYSIRNFCCVQFHPEINYCIALAMAQRDTDNKTMAHLSSLTKSQLVAASRDGFRLLTNFISHN